MKFRGIRAFIGCVALAAMTITLLCSCGRKDAVLPFEGTIVASRTTLSLTTSFETVSLSSLYEGLPAHVSLEYSDEQSSPWILDADIIVPAGLTSIDVLRVDELRRVADADWNTLRDYYFSPEERFGANDFAGEQSLQFRNDAYVKNLSMLDGSLQFNYNKIKTRSLDADASYVFSEAQRLSRCPYTRSRALSLANEDLQRVSPAFEWSLWRIVGMEPAGGNSSSGSFRLLYAQLIDGIPIANPCCLAAMDDGSTDIPPFAGAQISVGENGLDMMHIMGFEVTDVVKAEREILSYQSALSLYKSYVYDGQFIASNLTGWQISVSPLQAKIDRVRLCYVVSIDDRHQLLLVPCWLFTGGSASRGEIGIGFHAITGKVIWFGGDSG